MIRQTGTVRTLLHAGANSEQSDQQGTTPLMDAAAGAHTEVVKLLLKHGATVDARNNAGETALIYMGMAAANEYVIVDDCTFL